MKAIVFALLLCTACTSSCVNLARSERIKLKELHSLGIGAQDEQVTRPGLAGFLNILPGVGNFYITSTTDENQVALGFVNLLLWPWSVVWAIPQAAVDASTLNKRATVDYYYHTPDGRTEMQRLKEKTPR